ncbi:MAG: hypothetical protein KDB01_19540, partial [Planctomycetaceae bacterium]|nr:hypothetical protein [Planctomycetaceae bacterium]
MLELKTVAIRSFRCTRATLLIRVCRNILKICAVSLVLVTALSGAFGQNSPDAAQKGTEANLLIRRRITSSVDGSPIPDARVSIERIEREFDAGDHVFDAWTVIKVKHVSRVERTSDAAGYVDYETSASSESHTEVIMSFSASHEKYVPSRSSMKLEFLREHNPLPDNLRDISLWPAQEISG